ncbi:glycosyltransferase [Streptomyces sp. SID2563]|uniref:glycosyltransferase n=1 Tax=Streptomyces sp. SID2563 TaxID=2690255 RepID=UPI00136B1B0F|nr:glycosyltransferase [Streptomyces sp. SID2563]
MTSPVNPSVRNPKEQPDVSVVVDTLNCVDSLAACLESVLSQNEEGFRVEVLAFDRGSDDGTRQTLEQWAASRPGELRCGTVAPSETPAGARNLGIEQSSGRFLLFLNGTDRLGPGALRRMTETAETEEADVVLGKVAGLDGQKVGTSMFARNAADADVYTSRVYWSLSPDKLFRRTLVERCFLRFPTDWRLGEDQVFTALAYLYADRIAVVADLECVQQARRVAGVNHSRYAGSAVERMLLTRQMTAMVAERVHPGAGRDQLMARHMELELGKATGAAYLKCEDPEQRHRILSEARELLDAYATPGVIAKLPRPLSVRMELIRLGRFAEAERLISFEVDKKKAELLIERGRVYRRYPYFRDPEVGLADEVYEITHTFRAKHRLNKASWNGTLLQLSGHGYFEQLSTKAPGVKIVLRERRTGAEHRFRVFSTPSPKLNAATRIDRSQAGFEAKLELTAADGHRPIGPGLWDMYLYICYQGVGKEVRLGGSRAQTLQDRTKQGVVVSPADASGLETVCHLYATKAGNLTLEVSERRPLPGA